MICPYVLEMDSEVVWLGSPDGVFSAASAREVVREPCGKVDWGSVVWFRRHIPKHAFHVWVAVLDRMPTRDRLTRWGLSIDTLCTFCRQGAEERDHLFLRCCVVRRIWRQIMRKVRGPYWLLGCEDIIQWLRIKCGSNSLQSFVIKLGFGAAVYHIWMERNKRLFCGTARAEEDIIRDILFDIRYGIFSNKGYINTFLNRRIVNRL